jgi:hypothetical protein
LAALKAAAAARLAAGQAELGLGVAARSGSAPLPITASRAAYLWDALGQTYDALEFDKAAASYPTLNRRLRVFAKAAFRQALSRACAHHAALGPASLQVIDMPALVTSLSIGHCRCWPKKVNTLCHASAAASLFSPNPMMRDTACRGAWSAKLCPACGYVFTSCGIFFSVNTSSKCFPLPRLRGSRLPKLATMGQAPSTIVAYLRCRGGG